MQPVHMLVNEPVPIKQARIGRDDQHLSLCGVFSRFTRFKRPPRAVKTSLEPPPPPPPPPSPTSLRLAFVGMELKTCCMEHGDVGVVHPAIFESFGIRINTPPQTRLLCVGETRYALYDTP